MRYTENANMKLPGYEDAIDIEEINGNFEKTDGHIGGGTASAEGAHGLRHSDGGFQIWDAVEEDWVAIKSPHVTLVLGAAAWQGAGAPYTIAAPFEIDSSDDVFVDVILSSELSVELQEEANWAKVSKILMESDTITFYCNKDKPAIDLTVQIKGVK